MGGNKFSVVNENKERYYVKAYQDFLDSELFDYKEKIVFIMLKRFADFTKDKNGTSDDVFPSQDMLVKRLGMTKPTLSKILKSLEDKGVVAVKRQGLNKPNLYYIKDYKCIWESETRKELEEVIKEPDKYDHIKALEKLGYKITPPEAEEPQAATEEPQAKEKPVTGAQPETSNTAQPTNISFSNNDYKKNYAPSQDEIYSMDMIKHKFEYNFMLMDRPHEQGIIDSVFDYIYDTLNDPGEFIRVQRSMKPKRVVVSRFMKLTRESILFVIDRYQAQINRIQYPKQYIITQLYEAPAQFEMDITNRVMNDLYGA